MDIFLDAVVSSLRMALPLLFAAYGGLFSEKSGVANIALEAYLLASSFAAAATVAVTQSIGLGVVAGVSAALFVGFIFSIMTVWAKADQIIAGMAINLLAMSLIPVLSRAFFAVSGQTPMLKATERITDLWPFILLACVVVIFGHLVFKKTVFGLRIKAAGENPTSLSTQGVSIDRTRIKAILVGAAIAAFGGIYLSIGAGSGYTRNMSAGRGFIALAALIFGRWRPLPTLLGCLLFASTEAVQIWLQSLPILPGGRPLPVQLVQATPYIITLVVMAGFVGKVSAPKAINSRP